METMERKKPRPRRSWQLKEAFATSTDSANPTTHPNISCGGCVGPLEVASRRS
jgi:hypothetical protein